MKRVLIYSLIISACSIIAGALALLAVIINYQEEFD